MVYFVKSHTPLASRGEGAPQTFMAKRWSRSKRLFMLHSSLLQRAGDEAPLPKSFGTFLGVEIK
jgi:hypothetical protein